MDGDQVDGRGGSLLLQRPGVGLEFQSPACLWFPPGLRGHGFGDGEKGSRAGGADLVDSCGSPCATLALMRWTVMKSFVFDRRFEDGAFLLKDFD